MTIADESLELLDSVSQPNPMRELAIQEAARQIGQKLMPEALAGRAYACRISLESLARLSIAVSYGALNGVEVDHDAVRVDALEALMLAGAPLDP